MILVAILYSVMEVREDSVVYVREAKGKAQFTLYENSPLDEYMYIFLCCIAQIYRNCWIYKCRHTYFNSIDTLSITV